MLRLTCSPSKHQLCWVNTRRKKCCLWCIQQVGYDGWHATCTWPLCGNFGLVAQTSGWEYLPHAASPDWPSSCENDHLHGVTMEVCQSMVRPRLLGCWSAQPLLSPSHSSRLSNQRPSAIQAKQADPSSHTNRLLDYCPKPPPFGVTWLFLTRFASLAGLSLVHAGLEVPTCGATFSQGFGRHSEQHFGLHRGEH